MNAAVQARDAINATGRSLKIVAVTLLTSISNEDLREIGVERSVHVAGEHARRACARVRTRWRRLSGGSGADRPRAHIV